MVRLVILDIRPEVEIWRFCARAFKNYQKILLLRKKITRGDGMIPCDNTSFLFYNINRKCQCAVLLLLFSTTYVTFTRVSRLGCTNERTHAMLHVYCCVASCAVSNTHIALQSRQAKRTHLHFVNTSSAACTASWRLVSHNRKWKTAQIVS